MTREEADKLIESINAQVNEPKVEKWIPKRNELCEVTDHDEWPEYPIIGRFHSINECGRFVSKDTGGGAGSSWNHYRKLHTKATRHEWGGGECPVKLNQLVAIECKNGVQNINMASYFGWEYHDSGSDIVSYWELES